MSRKIKKKNKKQNSITPKISEISHKSVKKKLIIAIISALVLLALLITGIVAILNSTLPFDYMKQNLSSYITLSEEDYKGFSQSFDFREVDESDVERLISALLCENKNKSPLYNGQNVTNLPIELGSVAKLYYRGYTIDENGNETDFDSNLFSKAKEVEIGSGSFIPGFEEALLGIVPKDYARSVDKITEGYVTAFDTIYLSYKALYPDGSTADVTAERIDLRLPNIDKKYGAGFKGYLLGNGSASLIKIGEQIKDQKVFSNTVYYDMSVDYVVRESKSPLTIDVKFPATYHEASLRNVDAKFDVYVESVVFYKTPEYNEEFVTKTLGLGEKELSGYEGDGILEKHKSMLYQTAVKNEEAARLSTFDSVIWDYLLAKTSVKKLPEDEVEDYFVSEYDTVYNVYSYYQGSYNSFGDFAKAYYHLSSSDAWRDHIISLAENTVTKKLIIHYILRKEDLTPLGTEYDELYEKVLEDYLSPFIAAKKTELDACKTDAEYEEKMDEIRQDAIDYYGDDFFKTTVYYNVVMEKLMEWSLKE